MSEKCRVDSQKFLHLLREKRFAEALEELKGTALRKSTGLTSLEQAELLYYYARAVYAQGRLKESLLKVKTALRLVRSSSDHSLYASGKHLLGQICLALGRPDESVEAHLEAYVTRKRAGEHAKIHGSLINLALAHFSSGDLRQARTLLWKALAQSELYNTDVEQRLCRLNLSRVLIFLGEFDQSQGVLKSIEVSWLSDLDRIRVLEVQGLTDLFQMNSEAARAELSEALSFYVREKFEREIAVCNEFLGLNEFWLGNYHKAGEHYELVLNMPELRASARAQTLRMLTDVYVAEGNFDQAKKTASEAEEVITRIKERIELGALYRAYGQIYAGEADGASAREYFTNSIDLLQELGARYELALSHTACGQSPVYSGQERLLHLRRARDLFAAMQVPKRVQQVEEVIASCGVEREERSSAGRRSVSRRGAREIKHTPSVVARSKCMREIVRRLDSIKNSDTTILLTGETGTGKDLLAEYLHYTSVRGDKPFVAVNCAAIPESLLEAELFGVRRGSFTGSSRSKPGLLESCDGGSFYLDEIGEIPTSVQVKLLRVIDTKTVRRIGDTASLRLDVRFIAATNQDLRARLIEGAFRKDLFFRLQKIPINLPPLRERLEDIPALVRHFLLPYQIPEEVIEKVTETGILDTLCRYQWPGNVRELESLVERAVTLWRGENHKDLMSCLESLIPKMASRRVDCTTLKEALTASEGNQSRAARELGMQEATFRYHLRKHGL